MYQSETLDAVRDAAQQLTREGKVLTMGNPEFPLAVFADTYQVDDTPTNTNLPAEEIVAIEEYFDEVNQDSSPSTDGTREALAANLFAGISKVQFNTTNVIIPAIKEMHTKFAGLQQIVAQPEYAVRPWRYLAPHDSPVLVNHINTRYTNVRPKDSYRSFDLNSVSADAIIEMMAINNPHLEQEEVTEWALQVGSDRLLGVWNSLFNAGGEVVPAGLPYLTMEAAPFNVDELLTAYFLCGHYSENPEQVPGASVDLEDWEHTLRLMHEMFGFYLMRSYVRRAEAREQGELILRNETANAIENRRAVVIVNGDVFDPWIVGGGDFQAVLGAAISNDGATNVRYIEAGAAKYIAKWHAVYPLIKQSAIDYADRQCINNVIATFREVSTSDLLKDRWSPELEPKLKEAMRYLRHDDYENPYKVFSTLVCRVYFAESTYIEYLDAIDQFGQDFPKADLRELNTQATMTLVAIFLAKQTVVEDFVPVIEDNGDYNAADQGLLAVVDFEEEETAEQVHIDETITSGGEVVDEVVADEPVTEETEVETTEDEEDFSVDDDEADPYADFETTEEPESESEEIATDAEAASESDSEALAEEEESEEDETPLA